MNVREYLETIEKQCGSVDVAFVVTHAVKDEHSPFYDDHFSDTPYRMARQWLDSTWIDNYIVVNADHPPIDITGIWVKRYLRGWVKCAMITTKEDLHLHYRDEEQYNRMLRWYEKETRKQLAESLKNTK